MFINQIFTGGEAPHLHSDPFLITQKQSNESHQQSTGLYEPNTSLKANEKCALIHTSALASLRYFQQMQTPMLCYVIMLLISP